MTEGKKEEKWIEEKILRQVQHDALLIEVIKTRWLKPVRVAKTRLVGSV
jgi:hypothetical protein